MGLHFVKLFLKYFNLVLCTGLYCQTTGLSHLRKIGDVFDIKYFSQILNESRAVLNSAFLMWSMIDD